MVLFFVSKDLNVLTDLTCMNVELLVLFNENTGFVIFSITFITECCLCTSFLLVCITYHSKTGLCFCFSWLLLNFCVNRQKKEVEIPKF